MIDNANIFSQLETLRIKRNLKYLMVCAYQLSRKVSYLGHGEENAEYFAATFILKCL